jgi:hypothetical protein
LDPDLITLWIRIQIVFEITLLEGGGGEGGIEML